MAAEALGEARLLVGEFQPILRVAELFDCLERIVRDSLT
jgi:hypothetical protein